MDKYIKEIAILKGNEKDSKIILNKELNAELKEPFLFPKF